MSTTATDPATDPAPAPEAGFLTCRTGLLMPGVLLAAGVLLAIGTAVMDVPSSAAPPGPQVFPAIVAVACVLLAVLLAVDVVRHPESAVVASGASEGEEGRPRADRRAFAEAVGTVVVFIAALQPVGWLLTGAFLFWGVARALGSRRPILDVFLAVTVSSIVQLAFSAGLGLNLPPGILGGVF